MSHGPSNASSDTGPAPLTRGRSGSDRYPVFFLLAGEASGDLHGAHLARALRRRFPGARLLGTGGARMAEAGVELLVGLEELAVMGFAEVVGRLPFFLRLERRLRRVMEEEGVDLFLPIDYPGLNLRLTKAMQKAGVPVVYYIAPQVWAWKAHRTGMLARAADRVAVILPFEAPLFEAEGGRARYVGHPLLDEEGALPGRETWSAALGLDPNRPVLAIFPGSRRQELARHLGPFLEAADRVVQEHPEIQAVVARAAGLANAGDDPFPAALPSGSPLVTVEDSRALLAHAHLALVKSGTTTLEAALAGVPFVVAYRTHPLTWRIAKRVVKVPHVALANLVAGRRVVPELLQGEVTGASLAGALLPLVREGEARHRMEAGLADVRARLGEPGAADRVAALIEEVLLERGIPLRASTEAGPG